MGQKIIFPPLAELDQGPTFTVHIASFKPFDNARELFQKLMREGYEVYIIPIYNPQKGKVFRIALGNFMSLQEAENYVAEILKKGVSKYAKTMRLKIM